MEIVSAVMLLLGCSHDAQICEPAELDHPYYSSIAQCESDIPAQEHFAEGFPVTIVKCIEVQGLSGNEAVKIQWQFTSKGELIADARPFVDPPQPDADEDLKLAASKIAQ